MGNNKRPNQAMRTLAYLREHGSITSFEADIRLGIISFPKRILELKQMGFYITSKFEKVENRFGEMVKAKRYYLIEEPKEAVE